MSDDAGAGWVEHGIAEAKFARVRLDRGEGGGEGLFRIDGGVRQINGRKIHTARLFDDRLHDSFRRGSDGTHCSSGHDAGVNRN